MRIIDDKDGLLDEKVTVEMSLGEMALLMNAFGRTSTYDRESAAQRYYGRGEITEDACKYLKEAEQTGVGDGLYEALLEYLTYRGVYKEDE